MHDDALRVDHRLHFEGILATLREQVCWPRAQRTRTVQARHHLACRLLARHLTRRLLARTSRTARRSPDP